jgi:molybdenum cofactor cytidylyltransferase
VEGGADPVFVILGAHAREISVELEGMHTVTCLTNLDWKNGLASSLSVGLRKVLASTQCEAAMVTLADQPYVDSSALASLIAAFDDEHRLVASSYDGTIGVPALFAREFLDELALLDGDHGAGAWLRQHHDQVTTIPLEKAALDIDTPSDTALLG